MLGKFRGPGPRGWGDAGRFMPAKCENNECALNVNWLISQYWYNFHTHVQKLTSAAYIYIYIYIYISFHFIRCKSQFMVHLVVMKMRLQRCPACDYTPGMLCCLHSCQTGTGWPELASGHRSAIALVRPPCT